MVNGQLASLVNFHDQKFTIGLFEKFTIKKLIGSGAEKSVPDFLSKT